MATLYTGHSSRRDRKPIALDRDVENTRLFQSAMIDDACGGCGLPGIGGGARRGLLRQRRMLAGCGIPMGGGQHAVLALRRTATSSSGYDSFYSRHSPHRRCYMLRSIRDVPQAPNDAPPADGDREVTNQQQQQQDYDPNNGLESSQPRPSTLCTTDGRR